MKVTFILPCVGKKENAEYVKSWLMEPLAIAALSALTPDHIERVFYDDRLEEIPYDESTDLVAINVETYSARRAYQIAGHFRQRGIPVVMGGFHATLIPDEVSRYADSVVVGQAEELWGILLNDFTKGRLQKRYQSMSNPDLSGRKYDRSIYADKRYINIALVETARGCPFKCDFCSISSFFKRSYTTRPVQDVINEIKTLGKKTIFFIDDNIAVDPERTRKLLKALIPLKIRWVGQISINAACDESLLALMKKSGCICVLIGFESLNPQSLKEMGKTVNSDGKIYTETLGKIRKFGLSVYATFVFGYDSDTFNSFRQTLKFSIRNNFFFMAFNHLVPFPGTPLYDRLKSENRLIYDAWWLSETYRFGEFTFHPKNFSAGEVTELCLRYRKKFYSWSSILKRGLDFRSNCKSLWTAFIYFQQNFSSRKDVDRRQGLPLGLIGDLDPIIRKEV